MANDEVEVRDVLYTWNEGMSWESLRFSEHPVLVDNIMTEPKGNSKRFVIYGTRADPADPQGSIRTGVIFSLDFSDLHERACTGENAAGTDASDFERWAPSATSAGDSCLMGRKVEYTRRKRDRACYNGDAAEISHFVANCECTEHDWECDRGYKREPIDSFTCVRDASVPIDSTHLVPHYCRPGLNYHVSNGYRKVAGDSCTGGIHHEMTLVACPGSSWHHSVSGGGWGTLFILVALASALSALTFCQNGLGKKIPGRNDDFSSIAAAKVALLPTVLRRPAAIFVGILHILGSSVFKVWIMIKSVLPFASTRGVGAGATAGNIASAGGSFGSHGLGAESGSTFTGVSYDSVGSFEENVESMQSNASRTDSSSGTATRRSVHTRGGLHDDDDDFGLDGGDEEGESMLNDGSTVSARIGGSDDLLGLNDPLNALAPQTVSSSSRTTTPAKVPTLRPPRSHDGKMK
jgi:Sortilin, neurotensin receptor 3, C-terminal